MSSINAYLNASTQPSKIMEVRRIISNVVKKPTYHFMRSAVKASDLASQEAVMAVHRANLGDVMPIDQIEHAAHIAFDVENKKKKKKKMMKKSMTARGGGGRRRRSTRIATTTSTGTRRRG